MMLHANDAARAESTTQETLVEVLRRRATDEPERLAYTFLRDGEEDEHAVGYRDLDERARCVAGELQRLGKTAAPVLLLFDPDFDFVAAFFGCLYAGVVAVPVYPPEPRDPAGGVARIRRVAADAGASVVLTTGVVARRLATVGASLADAGLVAVTIEDLVCGTEASWQPPRLVGDDVAFLQYTSGSTGTPRGVMVTHANIIEHGARVAMVLGLHRRSVAVSWLPICHDMGLIGTLLIPVQIGFRSIQMPPRAFLERPVRWLRAIARHGGTLSPAPNFAYDLVVRKTTAEERRALDLGTWQAAMNGAEPIRAETCERFIAAFASCGFRREAFVPCYGLAEATLMVAGGPAGSGPVRYVVDGPSLDARRVVACRREEAGARVLVGSGRVLPDLALRIVHPDTGADCAAGDVGEICIAGPTIAAGYWRRPAETAGAFDTRLVDGSGPFLRTGDLGFVADGILYVTGRRKDLIVVRGRNHHPHDLEDTAAGAHPVLRPGGGAAFAVDADGTERVLLVHEIDADDAATFAAAAAAIREAIARVHGLRVHAVVLIPPRTLPKTTSGKVRRSTCRALLASGRLPVRWDEAAERHARASAVETDTGAIEACLLRVVAELREMPVGAVDRDAALAGLGIDSAEAAEVAVALEAQLGRRVPLALLMEQPTIAALAAALSEVTA